MLSTTLIIMVSIIAMLSYADVVDFGELYQYEPHITALPADIGLDTLWVSRGEGGYDFAFSPDVKDKVQGVLDGCGDANEQCYKEVHEVLSSVALGLDMALDRRDLAGSMSKAFKGHAALVDVNAVLVWLDWKLKHQEVQELGQWIPDSIASQAGSLATARAATISAEGTAVITITRNPAVTKRQGSTAPSVTAVTSPKGNYVSGDLIACLDEDLASRIGEMMDRSTHCKEGDDFDSEHHDPRKRAAGTYGKSICASIAVAANAAPGGPFNDLLLLNPNSLPFGFADLASAAAQAARVVIATVESLAALSELTPQLAEQVAVYIFALSLDKIYEGLPLGKENRIHATMVTTMTQTATTATATSTTTGCPDPTKTPILCGNKFQECPVQLPAAPKKEPTCKAGKYQGCVCSTPPLLSINVASPETQKAMTYLSEFHKAPQSDCPMNADTVITPIPATLFGSEHHNISNHFCEQWHSDESVYMNVDSSGKNKNPETQLRGRTPPPSASDWKDWDFELFYTPKEGGKKCSVDCSEAFYRLSNDCASNSGGVYMYSKGTLDVGCGDFGYNIHRAKAARREYERVCYKKEDFTWNGPVEFGFVNLFTQFACPDMRKPVKKDDKSTFRHLYRPSDGAATYQYNVWWKEGCELENDGPTEALISDPLGTSPKDDLACVKYLLDNYRKCNNGGVGGSIQVGCLIYEFKADRNERGW